MMFFRINTVMIEPTKINRFRETPGIQVLYQAIKISNAVNPEDSGGMSPSCRIFPVPKLAEISPNLFSRQEFWSRARKP